MSRMYDIIQELCRRDGTDVTKMCRALKIPRSTLSELASGRTKQLTLKHARPIAEYFGVTIAQLAGDEPLETEPDQTDAVSDLIRDEPIAAYENLKRYLTEEDKADIATLIRLRARASSKPPLAGPALAGGARMFKYTLAATLDEMDREGITVAECPLRSMRCLSLQNGRIVGINTARFDSSAEVRTALIHEDGHFASGAFYLPYSPYQLKAQAEYRADKAAVLKHIPYPELAARLRRGDTLADAAEYFCVTEDFLRKAYALYRDMGYDFGAEEKA